MRRLAVFAVAALGLMLALAGIAYAANTYTSTINISPAKTGSAAKPAPVSASLTFNVGDSNGQRPLPLKTYSIGLGPGIVPNNKLFAGCSFSQANASVLASKCSKSVKKGGANVGGGSVNALVGAPNDHTLATSLKCYLKVTLVNSTAKNHLNIRIDGGPTSNPPCVTSQHSAIDATFTKTGTASRKGGGKIPVYAIRFSVPDAILFPAGLASTVVSDVSNIVKASKTTGKGRHKVTHGYLESIGCPTTPKGQRQSDTAYTDTSGATVHSFAQTKCSA